MTTQRPRAASAPAARLLACIVLLVSVALAPPSQGGALGIVIVVALALLALRPSPRTLRRRLPVAALAVAATLVPLLLAGRGDHALWLAGRALACVVIAIAVSASFDLAELGPALSALGVPRALSEVVSAAMRQLGTMVREGQRLLLARRLRGATGALPSTELITTLLVRSALGAERIALARSLRGGENPGAGARLGRRDAPLLLGALTLAIALHGLARALP